MEGDLIDLAKKHEHANRVQVDYSRCHFCGACVAVCPPDAMFLWKSTLIIRIDKCTSCERCTLVCPVNALAMVPAGGEVGE